MASERLGMIFHNWVFRDQQAIWISMLLPKRSYQKRSYPSRVSRLRSGTRTQFRPMSSWAHFRVWCWVQVWTKRSYHAFYPMKHRLSNLMTYDLIAVMKCISSFFLGAFFSGQNCVSDASNGFYSLGLNLPGVHPRQRERCFQKKA